ncbi:hypothetical protein FXO38_04043 [Capsicum annuum]|nr:hypothetical protein FXO37_09607 [Capsicum annuum]KAF3676914.1 hypothetical protein FXO38_04043 [Capsicum annuum]
MVEHAYRSSSIRGIPLMNFVFDELPSFSLDLTQEEDINLISTNIQSKKGVSIEEVKSKQDSDLEKIVKIVKRKALRKSSSLKPTKVQKSVKKMKSVEKGESSEIAILVSSDSEFEEAKVGEGIDINNHPYYKDKDKLNLFDVCFMDDLPQQPSGSLDCGLYMVKYAEILTYGEGVPYIVFDSDLLRTRYASLLWDYGSRKEEDKAQSDDEAPMKPPREIGITEDTEVLEI